MRAKVEVSSVLQIIGAEQLKLTAVTGKSPHNREGVNEDNTYARYTPSATFEIMITNQALLGKFKPGQKYYVDFTPCSDEPKPDTSIIPPVYPNTKHIGG